jgi:hypothetical protein
MCTALNGLVIVVASGDQIRLSRRAGGDAATISTLHSSSGLPSSCIMPLAGLQSEPVLCDEPKGCCPLFLMGAVCGGSPKCTRRHPQFMRVCIRPPNTHVRPVNQHRNGAPPTQLKSQSWFSTQSIANFGMTQASAAASKRKRPSRSRSSSPERIGPAVKREKLAPQNLDVDDNCSSDSDVEIVVRSTQLNTPISAD